MHDQDEDTYLARTNINSIEFMQKQGGEKKIDIFSYKSQLEKSLQKWMNI